MTSDVDFDASAAGQHSVQIHISKLLGCYSIVIYLFASLTREAASRMSGTNLEYEPEFQKRKRLQCSRSNLSSQASLPMTTPRSINEESFQSQNFVFKQCSICASLFLRKIL